MLSMQQKQEEQGFSKTSKNCRERPISFGKGSVITTRVTDARRAVLLSSTRKPQTTAQLMQVKRQQDEVSQKLEKLDDQRRLDLLRELEDTTVKLNAIAKALGRRREAYVHFHGSIATRTRNRQSTADFIIRKSEKGRNGSMQSKIPSCSQATPSRSACATRTVLTSIWNARAVRHPDQGREYYPGQSRGFSQATLAVTVAPIRFFRRPGKL